MGWVVAAISRAFQSPCGARVYTVQFAEAIYVLHAFQKKSMRGTATPEREIDLIRRRLADAERLHRERQP
jgi:phage-related protein